MIQQEITKVTQCLTANHSECSGSYVDFSKTYVVKCGCPCHISNTNNE